MTIQSNTAYKWRLDIIRNHTKIGEATFNSMQVQFVENANITRSMRAEIPKAGFKTNEIDFLDEGAIHFDGSLCFDGTWCFDNGSHWGKVNIDFDMFSDRLKPILIINDQEYNFGEFLVIAAPLTDDGLEQIYNIEAYDDTMLLSQSTLDTRKYYPAGKKYLDIVSEMLTECGINKIFFDNTEASITIDHEYAIGTNYLTIVNDLLDEIGYSHVYAGRDGYLFIQKKITKNTADYYYTDKNSTIVSAVRTDTDIYSLPNVIVGYVSSPDIPTVLRVKKVNDDVNSVISTVRRGYNVVQAFQFDDCPDIDTLSRSVEQKFFDYTQATETAEVETYPDGAHPYGSYVALGHSNDNGLYREVEWSIDANGTMKHKLERKVFV